MHKKSAGTHFSFSDPAAGYKSVASISRRDTQVTLSMQGRTRRDTDIGTIMPGILEGMQCLGTERDIFECILEAAKKILSQSNFQALPPGSSVPVKDVAYVSCTGMCVYSYCIINYSNRFTAVLVSDSIKLCIILIAKNHQ